jgi:hypothetical protein
MQQASLAKEICYAAPRARIESIEADAGATALDA